MKTKAVLLAVALALLTIAHAQDQPGLNPVPKTPETKQHASQEKRLTLDEVLREALARNPDVQSAAHQVEVERHKISQAEALPDPSVSVGWIGDAVPFRTMEGSQMSNRSISAMQKFPFPGKLKLKGEIAGKNAEAAEATYEAVRRQVETEARTAYFNYFYYDKALQVTERDKDLLEKLSKISEALYSVGKGLQEDVLKSQTEISLLLQKITVLQQKRLTAQAQLNALMYRPPDSSLPPAADVALVPTTHSLDQLYKLAESNDALLERDERLIERSQLAVNLARKAYMPDLSVGVTYQQRSMLPDMKGATFTINIPIFYKHKQREGVREAEEGVIAATKSREARANDVRFEIKRAYLSAQAAEQLAELYRKAVLPQASLALESSMTTYQVGKSDFLTVLSNFSTLLNYETDYYRQVADYNTAMAEIENLTGVNVAPAQGNPTIDVQAVTR